MTSVPDKNTFANAYADKAPWDIPGPQAAFVAVADQLADQLVGSMLDAGCGTGENALYFAERGHRVTGVDFLDEPIRRARQKAADRGLSVDFRVLDALHLRDLNQTFDNVIDSGLFHVFSDEDRQRYVAALAAVLKPGGWLFLMCFSDAEPGTVGPRRVSAAELRAAFATGWLVESITPVRFQTIPEFAATFSPGGPHAWFVMAKRT